MLEKLTPLLVLALTVLPARAGDWYVDAVNGSDTNPGSSPALAWQTITHALTQVPAAGSDTLHVAPGVHDAALGETFLWRVRPRLSIVGAGPGLTVVDPGGSLTVFFYEARSNVEGWAYFADTVLAGFTLRNGYSGVFLSSDFDPARPALRDLEIQGMSGGGIYAVNHGDQFNQGQARLDAERVRCLGNRWGLWLSGVGGSLADGECSGSLEDGVRVSVGLVGGVLLTLQRCRLLDNGDEGFQASGWFQSAQARLEDCLVAGNQGHGVWSEEAGGFTSVEVVRCTVADNALAGLHASGQGILGEIDAESTIAYGNGDDVLVTGSAAVSAVWCDIGDGDFAGASGNFSADPLFVDPAGRDYRLGWGSPCAEVGDPATPAGVLDLDGNARSIDGDLDTVEAPDVGALELATLASTGGVSLGTILQLELTGPAGAPLTLYWTRQGTVAPSPTPFGELDLEATKLKVFLNGQVPPAGTPLYRRKIPNAAFLVGQTFAWQALVDSAAAPQGKAYTSAVEVTLLP